MRAPIDTFGGGGGGTDARRDARSSGQSNSGGGGGEGRYAHKRDTIVVSWPIGHRHELTEIYCKEFYPKFWLTWQKYHFQKLLKFQMRSFFYGEVSQSKRVNCKQTQSWDVSRFFLCEMKQQLLARCAPNQNQNSLYWLSQDCVLFILLLLLLLLLLLSLSSS